MIREDQAAHALGILVGGTTGWNDEAVTIYLTQLVQLDDAYALLQACTHILQTHTDLARPSLGKILDRYRYEYTTSRQHQPKPLPSAAGIKTLKVIAPSDGLPKAWDAYKAECEKQGRSPNVQLFNSWARQVGAA